MGKCRMDSRPSYKDIPEGDLNEIRLTPLSYPFCPFFD